MSASEVANDTLPSQKATMTTEERQQREAKATDDEIMVMSFFIVRGKRWNDTYYINIMTARSELEWGSGEKIVWVRWEQKSDERSERVFSPPKLLVTFGYKSKL